jgi:hypothetical protein
MTAVMVQRQPAVTTLNAGTAALEQVSTVPCYLLNELTWLPIQRLEGMRRLPQGGEQSCAQCLIATARLGPDAARSHALQVEGREELGQDRLLKGAPIPSRSVLHHHIHHVLQSIQSLIDVVEASRQALIALAARITHHAHTPHAHALHVTKRTGSPGLSLASTVRQRHA